MSSREESLEARLAAHPTQKIQTTVGELVEALTQVAIEAGNTEQEGYRLASLALTDLLKRRKKARAKSERESVN